MFLITGGTCRFVDGLTDFWAISFQDDWGVTEGNGFFRSNFLVFDETALDEVFFTIFLLLWFEISGVCSVTFFTVAMFASYNIVIFSFFYHYNFVDTSFTSSGNRSDIESYFITTSTASLTGITDVIYGVMSMFIMVSMMIYMMACSVMSLVSGVKGEGTTKILSSTLSKSACSDKEN